MSTLAWKSPPSARLPNSSTVSKATNSSEGLLERFKPFARKPAPAKTPQSYDYTRGELAYFAKLTAEDVTAIRLRASTESYVSLAREFGVTAASILNAATGKTWQHVTTPPLKARGTFKRGERNGRSKLTDTLVLAIRQRSKDGESNASLARAYSVSSHQIGEVVSGRQWRHVPMERPADSNET
jgi:hypothetical protein